MSYAYLFKYIIIGDTGKSLHKLLFHQTSSFKRTFRLLEACNLGFYYLESGGVRKQYGLRWSLRTVKNGSSQTASQFSSLLLFDER